MERQESVGYSSVQLSEMKEPESQPVFKDKRRPLKLNICILVKSVRAFINVRYIFIRPGNVIMRLKFIYAYCFRIEVVK